MPYSWDLTGIGGPTSLVQNAPQLIVVWLLRGALDPAAQHTFYALLFAAQLLAMMLLILTVLPGHRVAAVLGALFYAFNPATVIVPLAFGHVYGGFPARYCCTFHSSCERALTVAPPDTICFNRELQWVAVDEPSHLCYPAPFFASRRGLRRGAPLGDKGRIFARIAVLAGLALLANAYWLPDAYFWLHGQANQGGAA
jgi:hypothetical protein